MRITVIGTGYLGAVHAACLAELGHHVLGVDADEERVAALADGRPPFFEPGLGPILSRAVRVGRLRFARSAAEAAAFGEVHFICVGTPQQPGSYAADVSNLHRVIEDLVPSVRRDCLVVGKSTVPAGTAARLAGRVAEIAPSGARVRLAWNPEFLREGTAVADTLTPERVLVGVTSAADDEMLRRVYAQLLRAGTPWISTDLATAELAKQAANAFLATKVSFINAIADLCEAVGADVVTLAEALGHDTRIGRAGLSAGLGYGGSCLPKDVRALVAMGQTLGSARPARLFRQVDEINQRRPGQVIRAAQALAGGSLRGQNVAVLGAAFKPGTDDVRDSPALAVAGAVRRRGARVRIHDPQAGERVRRLFPELDCAPDAEKACADADLVLHLTEWPEYREADPAALGKMVRSRRLLDARNALPLDWWRAAGWVVRGVGRPEPAGETARGKRDGCGSW